MPDRAEPAARSPWIGRHGPLLIAEIGGNHEGDFEYAVRLTQLAIDSGADFVKFQLYRGATFVNPVESPDRVAHYTRLELPIERHVELARMCESAGVGYVASVWDLDMLPALDPYLPIYKIGSGDMTAYPVVRELASRGKPIILSTGLSTLDEVLDSVRFIQAANPVYRSPERLALLQCTSMYPIESESANLRVMSTLRDATGLAVGYSDHTAGQLALLVAAVLGADILEFHFTDDRTGKTYRDHKVSLTRDEVRSLCVQLDEVRLLLGDGIKRPLPPEVEAGHITSFRRAVYCRRALKAGEIIRETDLVVMRPNHGVDARLFDSLVGRRAAHDLEAFDVPEVV